MINFREIDGYVVTKITLTEDTIVAVSKLIDDSLTNRRDPSYSDLEFQIKKYGLEQGDPKTQGQTVGKAKRVRYVLNWALEFNLDLGEKLLVALLNLIRGVERFRKGSSNYVGEEEIINLQQVLKNSGYHLDDTGKLEFSGKEFILDFIIPKLRLCIEVKLLREGENQKLLKK